MTNRGPIIVIAAAICGIALLATYAVTMAPSLTWAHEGADGGDLVAAVAKGTIPHPPGYPTYLLLGEAFIRLPWRTPAWRLNLMSAVLAAATAGLAVVAAWLLLDRPEEKGNVILAAACAGLTLGLAPLFWSQALITEVYTPAALFTALVVGLALAKCPVWVLGIAWGAGTGAHAALLFLAPLVAWRAVVDKRNRFGRLAVLTISSLLSWGVLYGPVLLARGSSPSPWGDVTTLAGWWALVSGKLYQDFLFALPLQDWPQRLLVWAGLLARQFTPIGAVATGVGLSSLWHTHRSLAVASASAFGAFSLYAIGYNTTDSSVYLVLALPLAVLWLAKGLLQLADWLTQRVRRGAWAILLLPLLLPVLFWKQMDVSTNDDAMIWAEHVLASAPQRAVLLTEKDAHTFTLWYAQQVLGQRPDVVVLDRDLWSHEPYREMLTDSLALKSNQRALSPDEAARLAGRPAVGVIEQSESEESP